MADISLHFQIVLLVCCDAVCVVMQYGVLWCSMVCCDAERYFGPTKYPREKFSDLQKHDGTVHETHKSHDGTRPTEFSTLVRKFDESDDKI